MGEILLETKGATNIIPFENDITHETQRARDALVPPYVVTASMHMPKDEYRDFIFAIDKSGKKLAVITDGFHAGDKFSLSLDSNIIHDRINADWSGRLEMNTILPVDSKNAKACIKVDGKEDSIDVCHIITGAKSS